MLDAGLPPPPPVDGFFFMPYVVFKLSLPLICLAHASGEMGHVALIWR